MVELLAPAGQLDSGYAAGPSEDGRKSILLSEVCVYSE